MTFQNLVNKIKEILGERPQPKTMEIPTIKINSTEKQMPLKAEVSLKAVAILSIEKTLYESIKDKAWLTLVFCYSEGDAVLAAMNVVQMQGKKIEDYVTPAIINVRELSHVLENLLPLPITNPPPPIANEDPQDAKKKSVDNLVASVRYVFGEAGNEKQKSEAEKVIEKFLTHVNSGAKN